MDTILHVAVVAAGASIVVGLLASLVGGRSRRPKATAEARAAAMASESPAAGALAAWDVAMSKIEDYINRNLGQVAQIFRVSIIVMFLGFVLVAWGAYKCMNAGVTTPALLSAAAGTITEFIGATFLFVYRSTLKQAESFMRTLEKINRAGMALQVAQSMAAGDAKEKTMAVIAAQLLDFKDLASERLAQPAKPA